MLRDNLNAQVAAANARNLQTTFGGFVLRPYQVNVSALFVKPSTKGLLLYYKVGSGKTITSIAAVENLARVERRMRPVVVITPASLVENYNKELAAALGSQRSKRYKVVSFEHVHGLSPEARYALARDAVLVIDEAQNLRNPKSKRLESIMEAARVSHKRLLLSGTPVMNFPADVGPMLSLMKPELYEMVGRDGRFKRLFGHNGMRQQPQLYDMFKCSILFYEPDAETVRQFYPEKHEHWVPVTLTIPQVKEQFALALEDPGVSTLDQLLYRNMSPAFFTKPRQVNTYLEGDEHRPKVDEVVRRVAEEWGHGGKCIVYSSFIVHALHRIRDRLTDLRIPLAVFDGNTSAADKKKAVRDYNNDTVRVILLSDAGKEGLDLKNTTQIHIVEPAWNEEKIQQVIGRGVRYMSHTRENRRVDVYRYMAIFPSNYREYWPRTTRWSILMDKSADQILKIITDNKSQVIRTFLQRLVFFSQETLRSCV
jgi:superfamily II DNA or RNA helicase